MVPLIAASVVLCSWSLMFVSGREQTWLDRTDARWLLSLQMILLMIATQSPNPWVAIIIAWIALHPWIAHTGYVHGPLQFSPDRSSTYQPLFPVLWWCTAYLTIYNVTLPTLHLLVAYTLIVWSAINIFFAMYQEYAPFTPKWMRDSRSSQFPNAAGLVGSSYFLAFITSSAVLSSVYLSYYYHSWYFIPLAIIFAYFSIHTGTYSPIFATLIVLIMFASLLTSYIYLLFIIPLVVIFANNMFSPEHRVSVDSRLPAWKVAAKLSLDTWFIGIGLGMWNAITNPPDQQEAEGVIWRNLHNDWLQAIVELSPIPAICGILLLVNMWTLHFLYPIFTPSQLYGLLMVTYVSLYGIVYFPMRDSMPALLLAVSLVMMDK